MAALGALEVPAVEEARVELAVKEEPEETAKRIAARGVQADEVELVAAEGKAEVALVDHRSGFSQTAR